MADAPKPDNEVKILPPDRSMQQKIGTTNLDQLLSNKAVESAQDVIARSSDQFFDESNAEAKKLEQAMQSLMGAVSKAQALREVMDSAFSLKAKAGLGGYELISLVTKSLHQYCDRLGDAKLVPANLTVIKWHVDSIRRLLDLKVKGLGGVVGQAIIEELNKLDVGDANAPR